MACSISETYSFFILPFFSLSSPFLHLLTLLFSFHPAGEFQKAIGANSKSYYTFMNQNGPTKGSNSMVYQNAFAFFKHRELNGIKAPKKPKLTSTDDDDNVLNVSDIALDGEEEGEVEVYDTCDSARQKIRAFLSANPAISQASFCREISKTFHDGKSVSSTSMSGFLSKKGPREGNTCAAFYASYVFFEKVRIRDGKPKSEFREIMEDIYDGTEMYGSGKMGMDVKKRPDRNYIVSAGYRGHGPVEDEFGRVRMF
jgi:hypothetical protein